MKKLFLLFTVLSLAQLSSCGDGIEKPQYDTEVSKVYRGENLELTLNNEPIKNRVVFTTPDRITADIVMPYVIPGYDSLVFNGVELRKTTDNGYTFDERIVDEESAVSFIGDLRDKLKINVTHSITSPMVGIWKPRLSPLGVVIVPKNPETDSVDLKGFMKAYKIPVTTTTSKSSFEKTISTLGMVAFGVPGIIKPLVITLHDTGDLTATWRLSTLIPNITVDNRDGVLERGMVRYNVKNSRVYVAIDLESLLGSLDLNSLISGDGGTGGISLEDIDIEVIYKLIKKLQNGLPLNSELAPSGSSQHLVITITRAQMLPYIRSVVDMIAPLLADFEPITMSGYEFTPENITAFLNEFARVVEESEDFTLTFKLQH